MRPAPSIVCASLLLSLYVPTLAISDPGDEQWSSQFHVRGANGLVHATAEYNGDLIIAGEFTSVYGVAASYIARWDGTHWYPLGPGLDGDVYALAVHDGSLYAGGLLFDIPDIARWDGSTWSAVGGGMGAGRVRSLASTPWGLVAGGDFTTAGGTAASKIALWNGSTWSALGTGLTGGVVSSAAWALLMWNGDLYAGGNFAMAGGVTANRIARWNGSAWSALGAGTGAGVVLSLAAHDTVLVAAGGITNLNGTEFNRIARWDGATWTPMGAGITGGASTFVRSLATWNGGLYASGDFTTADGLPANNVALWNGVGWSSVGIGLSSMGARSLRVYGSELVAGGGFSIAGTDAAAGLASWNGALWKAFMPEGEGMSGTVWALTTSGGSVVAGGSFATAGGAVANGVARWTAGGWTAVGGGTNGVVYSLVEWNGDLYAGGQFTSAGGTPANNVARWNGTSWQPLGSGLEGESYGFKSGTQVRALAIYDGKLYAAGTFSSAGGAPALAIARWDGVNWNALGIGIPGLVRALAVHGGYLVAGGDFTSAGGITANFVARWDGAVWSTLDTGVISIFQQGVTALALWNGDLYVGGWFDVDGANGHAANVARWDGSAWWALGSPVGQSVNSMAATPVGLAVAGSFQFAGGPANHIARWNGSAWSALGSGLTPAFFACNPEAICMLVPALLGAGDDLYVGGGLKGAGGKQADNIARWSDAIVAVEPPGIEEARRATLLAPFPSPSRGSSQIAFTLARAGRVRIVVHDIRGALVRVVLDVEHPAGPGQVAWDGARANGVQAASGLYTVTLEAGGIRQTRRIVLTR